LSNNCCVCGNISARNFKLDDIYCSNNCAVSKGWVHIDAKNIFDAIELLCINFREKFDCIKSANDAGTKEFGDYLDVSLNRSHDPNNFIFYVDYDSLLMFPGFYFKEV